MGADVMRLQTRDVSLGGGFVCHECGAWVPYAERVRWHGVSADVMGRPVAESCSEAFSFCPACGLRVSPGHQRGDHEARLARKGLSVLPGGSKRAPRRRSLMVRDPLAPLPVPWCSLDLGGAVSGFCCSVCRGWVPGADEVDASFWEGGLHVRVRAAFLFCPGCGRVVLSTSRPDESELEAAEHALMAAGRSTLGYRQDG